MLCCRQSVMSALTWTSWNTLHRYPLPFAGGPYFSRHLPITSLAGEITAQGKISLLINLTSASYWFIKYQSISPALIKSRYEQRLHSRQPPWGFWVNGHETLSQRLLISTSLTFIKTITRILWYPSSPHLLLPCLTLLHFKSQQRLRGLDY